LTIEAFKADGNKLATSGTETVNADGTFSFKIAEDYTGPVLIRLKDVDTSADPIQNQNYKDDATGAAHDLTTDLRAIFNVSGHGDVTIAITPLTELAVRELLGDAGGDAGTAAIVLGQAVTTAQVSAANSAVAAAFHLPGDILTTAPVTVDDAAFANAATTAAQKAYGQALAAIAGAESPTVGPALSTGDVLNALSQGLVGSQLSQSTVDLLVAGAAVADAAPGAVSTTSAAVLTTAIGTGLTGIHISVDSGKAGDFITSTAAQDVTATLTASLGTNHLWGSVNGGSTWTDVTSFVTGTSVAWTPVTLNGSSTIQFAVSSLATGFTGAAKDVVGSVSLQAYAVDIASPAITSSANPISYAENSTAAVYKANATDANLVSYSLGGVDAALFSIDSNSGSVAFIAPPDFETPKNTGATANAYAITVLATDGAGNQSSRDLTIQVTNVNEAPSLTSGAASSFAENGTGTAYTVTGTDPDASTTLIYAIAGGVDKALFQIDSGTGVVTFVTAPNFEAPAHAGNVYNITVSVSDGNLTTGSQAVAITVTDVNEAPALDSAGSSSVVENTLTTTTVYTAHAVDPEGAALTYLLGGTDAGLFNLNATTGAVTFANVPNFEAAVDVGGNNVYDITVSAFDGVNTTLAKAVAITVTDVNEVPVMNSAISQSVAENTLTTTTVYTAHAVDPEGAALSYILGGTDAGLFHLDATTGAVTFNSVPNFEVPADSDHNNVYDITLSATDHTNTTAAQAVAITVTDVNEAPTSTAISAPAVVVSQLYTLDLSSHFTDVDAADLGHLTYSATNLLPGLVLDTATGVISGTVTGTGVAHVSVTATDSATHTTSQAFDLTAYVAPTLSSNIDNVTNLEVTSNIVLTSTEQMAAVAGKFIHIVNDANSGTHLGFHGEAVTNTLDIQASDLTHISFANNTITINPGFDLDFGNNYHITVDAGAFVGVASGLGNVAVTDVAAMNFGTVTPVALGTGSGVAAASQAMVNGTDAMIAGHNWLDVEGSGFIPNSPVQLDLSTGNVAVAVNDVGTGGIATNDFYVALNNFASGDLVYFDNHGDNTIQRQALLNDGTITVDLVTGPTHFSTAASGSLTGQNGGQFDVAIANASVYFLDTAALKVLLGNVPYEPIVYG
jgi:hypothetical protein